MKNGVQRLIDVLAALLLLSAASLCLYRYSVPFGLLFSALTILYVAFYLSRRSEGGLHFFRYSTGDISSVLANILKAVDAPVLIVGSGDKVIWANKCFEDLPEMASHVLLPSTNSFLDGAFTFAKLEEAYEAGQDTFEQRTAAGFYRVRIIALKTKSKIYYATFWAEATKEFELQQALTDNNAMIAFIAVDNASELSQNGSENFRLTVARINLALTEWAKSMQAILLEYEDGMFLMLFNHDNLARMEESKFSIIDEVSALSSDNNKLPLTISIGVSEEAGTLADKQTSAQNALRNALQRGGATAVIKTRDGYRSFGGKTKSVQRQTSIRSRICRDLLMEHIRSSSNVLVMGHRRPDFDSIASNVGIAKLVSFLGKPVHIVTDRNEGNIANAFQMLKSLPEYETMFVDARRGMDLMTPDTLLVITDASNPSQFFSEDLYQSARRVIVIDHHTLDKHLGEQVLTPTNIDPNASSASELVCEILELSIPDGLLQTEEAQLMMLGILLDTQFFARDTGSRTFRACSYLRTAGADPARAKLQFKTDPDEYECMDRFDRSRYSFRDKFMIAYYDGERDARNMVAAAKCAERLVGIQGIAASFVLYAQESGISLSARSDGTFNVVNIVSRLGGGGHFQSAGARLVKDGVPVQNMKVAREMLEEAIDDYLHQ
ncbi:MAG: DHH family phosphoesterase [Oscillospiraceae bacterium]|nr:DHH family phosphoesterase [Oscillospiraceae bacterium]